MLAACTNAPARSTTAPETTGRPVQDAITTTTALQQSGPALREVGEPFTLGAFRVTVLSVQDPFPSTPQLQPAPGNRLLSVRYEVVSQRFDSQNLPQLPHAEIRDPTGANYQSEHGRLSEVNGARAPGEVVDGRRIGATALFEVPAPATDLRVVFRAPAGPGDEEVGVALN